MRAPSIALALVGLAALAGSALAHPHVWIDNVTTFRFAEGRIVAIRLRWTFDEMFGGSIIGQFDRNRNKRFEPQEMEALKKGAFDNLEGFGWFTHLTVDMKSVPVKAVTDFKASVENGRLVYEFTIPVDPPIDPLAARVGLGIYDPEFFVDVEVGGRESVRYEGLEGLACRTNTAENARNPIYGGQVNPMETILTCARP